MMDERRWLPVALCTLSLGLSLGCGGKKAEEPPKPGAMGVERPVPTAATAVTAAAVADAPKGAYIAKFRIGTSAGPEGVVLAEARSFGPGETFFASFEVPNAPAGSKIRATWAALPDRKSVSRQDAPVSADKPHVVFKTDPKGWPVGDYEFQIGLVEAGKDDARPLGSAPFKISRDRAK